MVFKRLKDSFTILSFSLINGIFIYAFVLSVGIGESIRSSRDYETRPFLLDQLQNLKWLSLIGLVSIWILGYTCINVDATSRIVRRSVIGITVIACVLFVVYLLSPSH